MEDTSRFMVTTPTTNGDKPLPRRVGIRSPVQLSWVGREVEVSYDGPGLTPAHAKGVLADYGPWGLWVKLGDGGLLQVFSDRIATVELAGD